MRSSFEILRGKVVGGESRLLSRSSVAGVSGGVPALVLGCEEEGPSESDMELKVFAPDEPEDMVIV